MVGKFFLYVKQNNEKQTTMTNFNRLIFIQDTKKNIVTLYQLRSTKKKTNPKQIIKIQLIIHTQPTKIVRTGNRMESNQHKNQKNEMKIFSKIIK